MKKLVIGLNLYGHDTGAFTIIENKVYAISEERFTRIKHDFVFPIESIKWILSHINIDSYNKIIFAVATTEFESFKTIETVYSDEILGRLKLSKKLKRQVYIKDIATGKFEFQKKFNFKYLLNYFKRKLNISPMISLKEAFLYEIAKFLPEEKIEISFYDHHLSHAAGAEIFTPYKDAALVTIDGWGDGYFSKVYRLNENNLEFKVGSRTVSFPNIQKYNFITDMKESVLSIGHIYSVFTELLGFTPLSDEGKVEALAAFSQNHVHYLYDDLIKNTNIDKCIITFNDDMNNIFDDQYIAKLLKKNKKEDIAFSVQKYLEDVMLKYVKQILKELKTDTLILCGGVAANVIMNKKIFDNITEKLYVFPAMGDDGLAAGAWSLCANENGIKHDVLEKSMPYYGTSFSRNDTLEVLKQYSKVIIFKELGNDFHLTIAELVSAKQIGALFMGRMEYGPRSLGNRSIIADVRDTNIHKKMNLEIKKRPEFQPFCPSILLDEQERLFDNSYFNKHMTCAFKLKDEYIDIIPGVSHVDKTARVQFVSKDTNEDLYKILKEVKNIIGFGALINTSFNKHGRTIVNTPNDAITDFIDTDLDFLFINGFLIKRIK